MKKILLILELCVLGFSLNAVARGHEPLRTAPDTYQNYKSTHLLDTLIVTALGTYLAEYPGDCVIENFGREECRSELERYCPIIDIADYRNDSELKRTRKSGRKLLTFEKYLFTDTCIIRVVAKRGYIKHRTVYYELCEVVNCLFEKKEGEWFLSEVDPYGVKAYSKL